MCFLSHPRGIIRNRTCVLIEFTRCLKIDTHFKLKCSSEYPWKCSWPTGAPNFHANQWSMITLAWALLHPGKCVMNSHAQREHCYIYTGIYFNEMLVTDNAYLLSSHVNRFRLVMRVWLSRVQNDWISATTEHNSNQTVHDQDPVHVWNSTSTNYV